MAQNEVLCPICGGKILDHGKYWACESGDRCPERFKTWKEMSGYTLSVVDLVDICNGALTEEHEFISKAKGTKFKTRLGWSSEQRKVEFKFGPKESTKKALCPDHNVSLRVSDSMYHCTTKLEDGNWCPVKAWRSYGGRALSDEELGNLLLGVVLGPWDLTSKDGKPYQATAEWDFGENKVKLTYVNNEGSAQAENRPASRPAPASVVPVMVSTGGAETAEVTGSVRTDDTSVTAVNGATAGNAPKWVEVLPQKAAQVTQLLGLGDEDSELILEAAIAAVTGSRGKTAKDIATREEALAVVKELNELAIGRLEPQPYFGDDGSECYVLVRAS